MDKYLKQNRQKVLFEILDLLNFDYDTTPACKAVLIAKILSFNNSKIVLEFFLKFKKNFMQIHKIQKN